MSMLEEINFNIADGDIHLRSLIDLAVLKSESSKSNQPEVIATDNAPGWAYRILGVDPKASDIEVKNAFRLAVKRFHPDRFTEKSSQEESSRLQHTERIIQAYRFIVAERQKKEIL